MNFNTLVNTQGLKGSRRGGNAAGLKEAASKAVGATASVTKKAATTVVGWAPATNNKVNKVEYEAITRDREVIYEVRKNREAINEVRVALGMATVVDSSPEEVLAAVTYMEEAAQAVHVQAPPNAILRKLQQALGVIDKNMPKAEEAPQAVAEEEVVTPPVVVTPVVPTQGATRRFISSPDTSTYDYSELTDQA